jgi:hypothetical protein
MHLDLDEFYSQNHLEAARDLLLTEYSEHINRAITDPLDPNFITILFPDAQLELSLSAGRIDAQLNTIPTFLEDQYHISNVIECSPFSKSLSSELIDKPPKYLGTKNNKQRCELFILAKLIENALIAVFHLTKFSEFQFYSFSGEFLGTLTRLRLMRDVLGIFHTHDCLIFADRYVVDAKDVHALKDFTSIIDKEDYCFAELPEVLEDLDALAIKPYVQAEEIARIERLHRIRVPKKPIFYQVPFLAWNQRRRAAFYVPEDSISELIL